MAGSARQPRSGCRARGRGASRRRACGVRRTSSASRTTRRRSRLPPTRTALGMAGGDGSLGTVAQVAIERDLPVRLRPVRDAQPLRAGRGPRPGRPDRPRSRAFEGRERRIDVGRVGDRVFLNNVSLGVYAHLVHRREHRRRRREALARLRSLAIALRRPQPVRCAGSTAPHADGRRPARRQQRVPPRPLLARRAQAARRAARCTSTSSSGVCPGPGRSGAAERFDDRGRRPRRCRRRSTASRSSCRARSRSGSSRARYACSSQATSGSPIATSSSGGSSSGANQRSSATSSAAAARRR